jgi:hypothetical protein
MQRVVVLLLDRIKRSEPIRKATERNAFYSLFVGMIMERRPVY